MVLGYFDVAESENGIGFSEFRWPSGMERLLLDR